MGSSRPFAKAPSPSMASLVRSSKGMSLGFRVELLPIGVFQYLYGELVVGELRPLQW